MNTEDLLKRVDQLIGTGHMALSTKQSDSHGNAWLDCAPITGFRAAGLSFINYVYGKQHPYYEEFEDNTNGAVPSNAECGIKILEAIKSEIDGGWLFKLKELVASEFFADFIEMAEHLLDTGYKDPAAVICGSVLEEHLRQLCIKNGIPVEVEKKEKMKPLTADQLNADLARSEVYSKLDQKNVIAWIDLRNKAAHGKYGEYNNEQVEIMINGVTEFTARSL